MRISVGIIRRRETHFNLRERDMNIISSGLSYLCVYIRDAKHGWLPAMVLSYDGTKAKV